MKNTYTSNMNLKAFFIIFFLTVCASIFVAQSNKPHSIAEPDQIGTFDVKQISSTLWNTTDGLPQKQVPGVSLGAASFEIIDSNHAALLSNSSSEVFIIDIGSGKVISKFSVNPAPIDFAFDQGKFYILNNYVVSSYDANGKFLSNTNYSRSFLGVVRIGRFNNSTYLLLPNGNSLLIESNGQPVDVPKEVEGWITSKGNRIATRINGDNSYTVTVFARNSKKFEGTFITDKVVAGVFVIGEIGDRILVDVQTYISENPITIERKLTSLSVNKSKLGQITAEIKIPDVYYVLSSKDFLITSNDILYHMLTAPEGVFIFKLIEVPDESKKGSSYPEFIAKQSYHYNNN